MHTSTKLLRQCPFHGCDRRVSPDYFCCRSHWYSLNQFERRAIYAAYQAYKDCHIGIEELRARQQVVLGERGTA